jgi:hypothetical protein
MFATHGLTVPGVTSANRWMVGLVLSIVNVGFDGRRQAGDVRDHDLQIVMSSFGARTAAPVCTGASSIFERQWSFRWRSGS